MVAAIVSALYQSQNQESSSRLAKKSPYRNSTALTAPRQVVIEGARAAYNQMCLLG